MANIAVYAKRAKAYRRTHPNTSWQNAMKIAARGSGAPRKRRVSGTTAAVGKTRRRVSGTTAAVGRSTHRRRTVGRGFLGNTGSQVMQVAKMGAGMAAGMALTHFVLRPIEAKIAAKYPMAGKGMAAAEVLLGGFMALKSKNAIVKSVGVGIMAGGAHGLLKQFNIHHESPAVSGIGEFTNVTIPVSGSVAGMLAGMGVQRRMIPNSNSHLVAGNNNYDMHNDLYKSYLFA